MNIYRPVAYVLALIAPYTLLGGCDTLQTKEAPKALPQPTVCLEKRVESPKTLIKNVTYREFLTWQLKSQIDEYNSTVKELEKYRKLPQELQEAAEDLKTVLQK